MSGTSLPFTLLAVLFLLQGGAGCFSEDNFPSAVQYSALPLPGHSLFCFISPLWLLNAAFFPVSGSLGTLECAPVFFFGLVGFFFLPSLLHL